MAHTYVLMVSLRLRIYSPPHPRRGGRGVGQSPDNCPQSARMQRAAPRTVPGMNTPDEFTNLRRCPRGGVWATLAIPETRLKEWVTDGPYRARGSSNVRGVRRTIPRPLNYRYSRIWVRGNRRPLTLLAVPLHATPLVRRAT